MIRPSKTKTKTKPKKRAVRYWKAVDFIGESKRILKEHDSNSDSVLCGAMMLAALRDGPGSLTKLAATLEVDKDRLRSMYDSLRRNKVFGAKKIYCEWFDEENGGIAFTMDVCVGIGWMNKVGTREAN